MNLIDRVLSDRELVESPPVLVDVGAAGGVAAVWRKIAKYSIGVGFEPDEREAGALTREQQQFRRWIFCPSIAVEATPSDPRLPLHLTRAPQCSSRLAPRSDRLAEWVFADQFEVLRTQSLPAASLTDALKREGLSAVDWLKFDTQGTDLRLYKSLSAEWRSRLLLVEFEPGLIEAYEGEDHASDVLSVMREEPFWLAGLDVGRTPRGRMSDLKSLVPAVAGSWLRRLAPAAPGWVGLSYIRDIARSPKPETRRDWLLVWVFATLKGQPGYALAVAREGRIRFEDELFAEMELHSAAAVRSGMVLNIPEWIWRRFFRKG